MAGPVTVEDVDREIARYWKLLTEDPRASAGVCRSEIDRLLDRRLHLMETVSVRAGLVPGQGS